MDFHEDEGSHKPNPLDSASFLSKIFFIYVRPVFRVGYKKKDITAGDLFGVTKYDSSEYQGDILERQWNKQLKGNQKGKESLHKALWEAYGSLYMLYGLGGIFKEFLKVSQPIFIGLLIDYFSVDASYETRLAYLYATLVALNRLVFCIFHGPYYWAISRMGMDVRVALCTLIYKKVLKLSNNSLQEINTGRVHVMMTSDVNRFDQLFLYLHYLWLGPLEALVILILLYLRIGWACLPGYFIMFALIPGQTFMSRLFLKLRKRTVQFTDKRITLMTEIITAMRTIKMLACESVFAKMVEKIRDSEIRKVLIGSYAVGINLVLGRVGYRLLDVGMILAYVFTTKQPIRASTMFVIVSFCRVLSNSFMRFFPRAIQLAAECHVTVKRVESFLLLEEFQGTHDEKDCKNEEDNQIKVSLNHVTCSVNKETEILQDISFDVSRGQLTAVIGPVGSGKSSLLLAILKELPLKGGSILLNGQVAYVRQQPWVFGGSIRQNIIFGKPYEEAKFDKIARVCSLDKDLNLFPDGDLTMIGERGVTLSGGQKARVSLARALYSDADVFLLDDPLSAVDSEVSREIFNNCILGYLGDKTCILVTHQLQYLNKTHQIVVLDQGKVKAVGTLKELEDMKIDFTKCVKVEEKSEEKVKGQQEDKEKRHDKIGHRNDIKAEISKSEAGAYKLFFKEEKRKMGSVGLKLYLRYFKAGTNWFGVLLLAFFLISAQGLHFVADLWLAWWADAEEAENQYSVGGVASNVTYVTSVLGTSKSAAIYGAIVAILVIFSMVRALFCFRVMVNASKRLHQKMLHAVIKAPISFFDTTPTGRIQNRFTKDVGIMDDNLPLTFFQVLQLIFLVLGTVLVNAIFNPYSLILIVPISIVFIVLWRYALCTTRPIKRLDGTIRSPIFSHTTTTMEGLQTVRVHHCQSAFLRRFRKLQDNHTEVWFMYLVTQRWFASRVDFLLFLFSASIAYAAVLAKEGLDAGLVGLLLSNTISTAAIFQYCISQMALVENLMTSTERAAEYSKLIPEGATKCHHKPHQPGSASQYHQKRPPPGWPTQGAITLKDVSLSYLPTSPPVLKNISCSIQPQEKIGIVGRTGGGKSSLIAAIFRLVEPSGIITIDGIQTSSLSLADLRTKLSIIPQDPVLFSGGLRMNLDPFQKCSDEQLWQVLKDVQLSEVVGSNPQKLDMGVGAGGCNFSMGQRQLICLARALLRRNRILILDEATANVDPQTDTFIQQTIHSKFDHCVVLTVAHRLNTVIESHRVMVLDSGTIVEFDHPYILLRNPSGSFSNFIAQLGPAEADRLSKIAKESYEKYQMAASEGKVSKLALEKRREADYQDGETKEEDIAEMMPLLNEDDYFPRFKSTGVSSALNGGNI